MAQALLLGLEERRLGEGAVGVRLLEGRVVVGVLDRCSRAEGRGKAAEVAQLCAWSVMGGRTRHCGGRTLEIGRLLLAERGAHLADARGQGDFEVLRHDVVALAEGALLAGVAHHGVDALDGLLAALEAAGDGLGEQLDLALLALLDVLVVEAGQHVLLVQRVEAARLPGDVGQQLGDVVLHVEPARRQQVHLDDGVAVVVVAAAGHEALALLGAAPAVREAIGGRRTGARPLRRVVRVRLAVGDEAAERQRGRHEGRAAPTDSCGPATFWRRLQRRAGISGRRSRQERGAEREAARRCLTCAYGRRPVVGAGLAAAASPPTSPFPTAGRAALGRTRLTAPPARQPAADTRPPSHRTPRLPPTARDLPPPPEPSRPSTLLPRPPQPWCVAPPAPLVPRPAKHHRRPPRAPLTAPQADSLTEEQVSEFKEAFSLFVSPRALRCAAAPQTWCLRAINTADETARLGQGRRWSVLPLHTEFCDVSVAGPVLGSHTHSRTHFWHAGEAGCPSLSAVDVDETRNTRRTHPADKPPHRPNHHQGTRHRHALPGPEPQRV